MTTWRPCARAYLQEYRSRVLFEIPGAVVEFVVGYPLRGAFPFLEVLQPVRLAHQVITDLLSAVQARSRARGV